MAKIFWSCEAQKTDFVDIPLNHHWSIDCNNQVFFDNMTEKIMLKIKE